MNNAVQPRVWVFVAWAVAGLGLSLTALTALTIGVFIFPATAALLVALLVWRGGRTFSALGLLSGLGLMILYVGYLNRGGPGEVCGVDGTRNYCTEEWNPWPEFVVGMVLLATGVGLFTWLRRRSLRL